jgi:hypothetical protein
MLIPRIFRDGKWVPVESLPKEEQEKIWSTFGKKVAEFNAQAINRAISRRIGA